MIMTVNCKELSVCWSGLCLLNQAVCTQVFSGLVSICCLNRGEDNRMAGKSGQLPSKTGLSCAGVKAALWRSSCVLLAPLRDHEMRQWREQCQELRPSSGSQIITWIKSSRETGSHDLATLNSGSDVIQEITCLHENSVQEVVLWFPRKAREAGCLCRVDSGDSLSKGFHGRWRWCKWNVPAAGKWG